MDKYETTDVSGRVIEYSTIAFAATLALTLAALWIFYRAMETRPATVHLPPPIDVQPQHSGPTLQRNPSLDLRRFLAEERRQLESYGWVDAARQRAQIPIDRAMELILQQGLPRRK